MVFVVAGLGAFGGAAAAPLVGSSRADAGISGSFLPKELFGAPRHLATTEGGVSSRPLIGQMHQNDIVQQLPVDFAPEFGRIDLDFVNRFTLAIENAYTQH